MNEPTWRKPAGMGLILLMIIVWAVLVATVAGLIEGLPWPVHALYYTAAGIGWLWLLPIKRMLLWMETGRWR
jgi:carbon starvation protein CstA